MAINNKLLAESLTILNELQNKEENVVLQGTKQISRVHLNRLLDEGWLIEVIKGWYIVSRPGAEGDTTVWYTAFWAFIKKYCNTCFGDDWCLNPDFSLDIYSGKTIVPNQLIIKSPKASNNVTKLLYGTSLLSLKTNIPEKIVKNNSLGINVYTLDEALINTSPSYYTKDSVSARTCLLLINNPEMILKTLADNGASTKAGRLAGAFRNVGKIEIADEIMSVMKNIGHDVREEDPFIEKTTKRIIVSTSPYSARISLMWDKFRNIVVDKLTDVQAKTIDVKRCLEMVDERYVEDAYHSLSIEGYKISNELIEKVKSGNWEPDEIDKDDKNALVARGYYLAFQEVKKTIERILNGENSGIAVRKDHSKWHAEMWSAFVSVGLLKPSDTIGYRNNQVYIRGSMHTPLNPAAVREAMPVLFELLEKEENATVRAVLGHFFFSYIHPYMDGNGRMSRFLMNVMLVTAGYDWVVIPVSSRKSYMSALEKASVQGDVSDFADFIANLLR